MKKEFKNIFQNIFLDEEERENEATKKALDFLLDNLYNNSGLVIEKHKKKVDGLRTYVKRLSECDHTYTQPLWEGLSKIKSDFEFIRYVKHSLEYMWD